MRKIVSLFLVSLFVAGSAYAHGGRSHQLMGTVKMVHEGQLVVTTKDGKDVTVRLTEKTKYEKAGKAATKTGLAPGARVSIKFQEDDKTAASVKIGSSNSK